MDEPRGDPARLPDAQPGASPSKRWLWTAAKWTLCLIVLVFVAKRAVDLWRQSDQTAIRVQFGWLMLSGMAYLAGWLPSVWFWRALMRSLGATVGFADSLRAYYCGHLGKYIPGKVLVPGIRATLVQDRGSRFATAALAAVYETLLMMGAGLAIGLALLPITGWPVWLAESLRIKWIAPFAVAAGCILLLPVMSKLLTYIAVRTVGAKLGEAGPPHHIPMRLIAVGLLAFVVGWMLQGLSLGLTLRAVSDDPINLRDWPVWTGSIAISTSIGFLMIFAPGGVGVREGLLMEVLRIQPSITEKQAITAAVLSRLVSLAAEIAAAVVLYYMVRSKSPRSSQVAEDS
ncbi:MAG: lysylphosphatidylglycerol synthase transmembrane domain-containing protein [Planctomycetaceae bacterium]